MSTSFKEKEANAKSATKVEEAYGPLSFIPGMKSEDKKAKDKAKNAEYNSMDFKKLLKNEKVANSVEYPFSNVHIEDAMFLVINDCKDD